MSESTEAAPTPSDEGSRPESIPENNPSESKFTRRAFGVAAVIGDYIYMDSGEVSDIDWTFRLISPVNATLSIDLSDSWSVQDVEIVEMPYEAPTKPALVRQSLLFDNSTQTFYTWAGSLPRRGTSPFEPLRETAELWRFEPSGNGRGEWVNETPSDMTNEFFSIPAKHNSAVANTPKTSFIFGGRSSRWTTYEPTTDDGGYVAFDLERKAWTHDRRAPYSETRDLFGGGAIFVPTFGSDGLVFILGGVSNIQSEDYVEQDENYISFQTVHFMDPETRDWYTQDTTVTGAYPAPRLDFCLVGVESDGDRFDIFMYGGRHGRTNPYSDVWILSLPAFHWTQVPGPGVTDRQRWGHSCNLVGRRQLLSWGGIRDERGGTTSWSEKDPFNRGLGVFDMATFEWKDEYDAGAAEYTQNQRIRDWYDEGNLEDVDWNDDVRGLFATATESSTTSPSLSPSPTTSSSPSPDPSSSSGSGSSSNIGPIVGGVLGGVAVVALIAGLWWFMRRKRRTKPQQPPPQPTAPAWAEMGDSRPPHAMYGFKDYTAMQNRPTSELPAGYLPPEMGNAPARYEVEGTSVPQGYGMR